MQWWRFVDWQMVNDVVAIFAWLVVIILVVMIVAHLAPAGHVAAGAHRALLAH